MAGWWKAVPLATHWIRNFVTIVVMKLRIKGDSLRLRLTQSEVRRLGSGGVVEESIAFGPEAEQALVYRVGVGDAAMSIRTEFTSNELTVSISTMAAAQWTGSDEVAIEDRLEIGNGRLLHVLIEKDFACLTARHGEADNDTFPNPSAGCGSDSGTA